MPNLRTPVSEPLRQVILAIDAKKWTGKNPIADVEPRRVPKRVFELYLGLRKGELFGLHKADVRM